MLLPKKIKHRKQHTPTLRRITKRGDKLRFGRYGLKVMESSWISSRQLEAGRRAMTRFVQREGKIWIRVFPDRPVTKKGTEVPMGKGKGDVDHFIAVAHAGRIIFEIDGVSEATAREALRLAGNKLSPKTRFIIRQ
ncbi:MAG: 50S ribosomal protein L16 [Candidatus Moranbacteria bacterium]|nr:50S ribosomal protein L16 [Candidatus Moranbacteria bacterium]